jgi:hypothetical protein
MVAVTMMKMVQVTIDKIVSVVAVPDGFSREDLVP